MNKQLLAKTHWNNPNGFHSRENSKSAVCIRLPFPNTQNKQKRHQRKVQMLNPFYFCFHRPAIQSIAPPCHNLCTLPGGLQCPAQKPRDLQRKGSRSHLSNHKKSLKWQESMGSRLQLLEQGLESQVNKCLRVSSSLNCHKEHSDSKQENSGDRARYFLKNQKLRGKKINK